MAKVSIIYVYQEEASSYDMSTRQEARKCSKNIVIGGALAFRTCLHDFL
jgi:hypothetical protein